MRKTMSKTKGKRSKRTLLRSINQTLNSIEYDVTYAIDCLDVLSKSDLERIGKMVNEIEAKSFILTETIDEIPNL